ncbi:D-arabinose 5-phosphate isomerase [Idiomarina sp. WRN-38]|jgi:arabinose-5-phosphate isomerase|uniref:Arabinose 5-phosphate isomerase n=1 Tax=Idiomarina piscisalsi TaxID=1096243 RepID=A0A432YUA7_9GAMM|nr:MULTISPECIES: KpsF/GutQ family sugar-phosphate isomerase [Idiomarina]KTG28516.1 D-arabinose 5-phosphate isomerase [Idiomarina sp. H105]OAF08044.1 D-arabinose 5-phosphate isomerase [Idiomarina sp. WRN-38]MCH2454182.1 KpsF/GutQ family sugar-phosphate isomerase [Idiomarina sp.]RUO66896.1 KpsF/GutQ family sugar-phosphate isomerase [Idiomarina piscisalsi]WPZ01721.1 KpsF/GutQ family sugar-phosphate isomerase [Idiomarina sp. OXR-189]
MKQVTQNFRQLGQQVLDIEKQAIEGLYEYLDDNFDAACQTLFNCKGRVIVTGMGKSGHIGGKIAATLASTGTPSFFVHPGEASHGDLGMVAAQDVVIAISNSGETSEVLNILPVIKRLGVPLIAMTGKPESTLARLADTHVCIAVAQEACPLGLAPTASTTATLVMGDALAVALLNARGFTADDFALSHPGGSLGKRLLLRLQDIMHTGERIPLVSESAIIRDALLEMSRKGLGMTAITDAQGRLAGIFTDGDLRRILDNQVDVHTTSIADVMTRSCTTANADMLAAEALKLMQDRKINGLIITDQEGRPCGAMNMHDLLQAGVL